MKVLVVGNGISGRSAYDFLLKQNVRPSFASSEDINSDKNLKDKKYVDRLFDGLSFIVKSPGVSGDCPLLKLARERNIKIVDELELGTENTKSSIIAVTGTNGKTTTVSLINFLLKDQSKKVFLGGNIGIPVTSFAGSSKSDDIMVLECSSYQLEFTKSFHPHIACILNFSPDHLARHKTMEAYIGAKQNITKNQTSKDFLILNADDETLMNNIPKTKAKI